MIQAFLKKILDPLPLKAVFRLTEGSCFLYLGWRLFFTLPLHYGWLAITLGLILFITELLGAHEYVINFKMLSRLREYECPQVDMERMPDVDVFIATYNEDPDLLYKTVRGCLDMEYPDPKKVHIYLCDDGRRESVKELAKSMGVGYFDRANNEGAKAGNLNNALKQTHSPYVVTLDADMIPRRNFLMKTIPYFVDAQQQNEDHPNQPAIKLGFVQTPQAFYNPDLFQLNLYARNRIPNEQDYFYREIEKAKTEDNSVIYGGSNTVLSRQALEDVGGFYTKAITEDFATGLLIQKNGYVSLGLSEPLASGLSPQDFPSLVQQRVRWGRGVVNVIREIDLFGSRDLSLEQKTSYFSAIWYWFTPLKRIVFISMPILSSIFGIPVVQSNLIQILSFWLPMHVLSVYSFTRLSKGLRSAMWSNVYETIMAPFLVLPILQEAAGISLKTFKVTSKNKEAQQGLSLRYYAPFVFLLAASLLGIAFTLRDILVLHMIGGMVNLFWLVYNGYLLVMALFFLRGRILQQDLDRRPLSLKAVLNVEGKAFEGGTVEMAEKQTVAFFNKPLYLIPGQKYTLTLADDDPVHENASVQAQIQTVHRWKRKWYYVLNITDYDHYDTFLRLLYDRPVEAAVQSKEEGFNANILLNLALRLYEHFNKDDAFPKMDLDTIAQTENGQGVPVSSMAVVKGDWKGLDVAGTAPAPVLDFVISCEGRQALLQGQLAASHPKKGIWHYEVLNLDSFVQNPQAYQNLLELYASLCQKAYKKQSGFWRYFHIHQAG